MTADEDTTRATLKNASSQHTHNMAKAQVHDASRHSDITASGKQLPVGFDVSSPWRDVLSTRRWPNIRTVKDQARRPYLVGRRADAPARSSAQRSPRRGPPIVAAHASVALQDVVNRCRCVGLAYRRLPSDVRVKSSRKRRRLQLRMTASSTSNHSFRFRITRQRRSLFSTRQASFVTGASKLSRGHILAVFFGATRCTKVRQ